ncbi:hypothetical protein ACRRTK_025006 [Alexandromys fortis]
MVCSGFKRSHSRKPLEVGPEGSQRRQLRREARGHRSEDKWPRVPHAGPAVPARSVSAPGSRRGPLTCRLVCSHLPASARVLPCRWRGPDSRRRAGRWFCKAGDNAQLNPAPLASDSGLDGPRAEEVTKLRLVV